MHKKRAVFRQPIRKINDAGDRRLKDTLVAEEPFTLVWQASDGPSERLTSTMRTPGDDLSLAAGLLFSEGVMRGKGELKTLSFCAGGGVNELNRLKAELRIPHTVVQERLNHRPSASLPQSACGLCAVDDLSSPQNLVDWAAGRARREGTLPQAETIHLALEHFEVQCPLFSSTGASHACLVVTLAGELLSSGEDVGRHNACDKAVGSLLLEEAVDAPDFLLPEGAGIIFSSRLSFELASKAVACGASWMASVGAPTHLAVQLAERCRLPLFGFVSKTRHNLYTCL